MQTIDHSDNIIELKNVSFAYGKNEVLKNIDLAIHRGDYLGLVGNNGSGKTTLIKIILGLLKPTSGTVHLFDSKLGYVPQKATNFDSNFPATVFEVVMMGRIGPRGLFRRLSADDKRKAEEALKQVEMWDFRDSLIGNLSSGQQQRVFIARALAGEPEVIFLDEPTVGVEKNIKDEFYDLLRKLNKELHLTIILVTHDFESIANTAMHIACIDRTLYFHDSVDEYLKSTHIISHPHN
jgi:zinc transport system ATP-binding protein